ncbi:hypothetical protein LK533_11780 [Sphingomonas sp. PL-96]|uniref:hypothetical protein n=1 Tax=Sphingomonas sp. PL-96 TaxID=2887201 RepID=UPI001E2B228B|nr:hypothetical protein [Sphingomonas sp. PL-96]MCC2977352.1 hypothetical protein [Sphingomonas sp. PL-96]
MRLPLRLLPIALVPLLAGGCVAKTAWNVATAPVRVGSQVVDWTTTSQDEADRNAGRKLRKQQAEEERQRRKEEKQARKDAERLQRDQPY